MYLIPTCAPYTYRRGSEYEQLAHGEAARQWKESDDIFAILTDTEIDKQTNNTTRTGLSCSVSRDKNEVK